MLIQTRGWRNSTPLARNEVTCLGKSFRVLQKLHSIFNQLGMSGCALGLLEASVQWQHVPTKKKGGVNCTVVHPNQMAHLTAEVCLVVPVKVENIALHHQTSQPFPHFLLFHI